MALTAEGRELTEAHRLGQVRVAASAAVEARLLWGLLNVSDLDGSEPAWMAAMVASSERKVKESQQLAGGYLNAYRLAEVGAAAKVVLGEAGNAVSTFHLAGPVRVKQLIAGGLDRDEAFARAVTKFEGIAFRQALMGGRSTVANTSYADRRAIGWRRVTSGNPCTFCAMLAARGPVYRSGSSARSREGGLRYHGHCRCSAEIVYGSWERSADEERYFQEYKAARERLEVDGLPLSTKNVLMSMRGGGGFRDSPVL